MELTTQLEILAAGLELKWTPREQNTEADSLSNEIFVDFDEANQVCVKVEDLQFVILNEFLAAGEALYDELGERKQAVTPLEDRGEVRFGGGVARQQKGKRPKSSRLRFTDPW